MHPQYLVAFILLLSTAQSINQACSFIDPCPNHSSCNPMNNYCSCQPGYIGSCNVLADPIGQYPQVVTLTANDSKLFYMKPIQVQQFIEFTLTICRQNKKQNVPIFLYVWTQTGSNSEYLSGSSISPPFKLQFGSQCNTLTTKYVMFGIQPNGESQMLILGIRQNPDPITLSLTVSQKLVLGISFYLFLMIGFIVFTGVIALISAALYVLRRRRRFGNIWRQREASVTQENNIEHFQTYMPSIKALEKEEKKQCPICLQSILKKQAIRVTPCYHTFHTACIDAWCIQNLTCPVCRSDFSLPNINSIKKTVIINESKRQTQYQENWQEQIEVQLQKTENIATEHQKNKLKQPML